ncbi:translation initiation factor IF-2 N-terminal domain-containing protein, partial [Mycolicibacterium sp. CBMA 213]
MSGKARVSQLAKELGVPAREILAWLSDSGEHVKSASSTVERPVARRLRAHYAANTPPSSRITAVTPPPPPNPFVTAGPVRPPRPAPTPPASSLFDEDRAYLTYPQEENIRRRFRKASSTGQDKTAINLLYLECQAQYGVSREVVRQIIEDDLHIHPEDYAVPKGAKAQQRGAIRAPEAAARPAGRASSAGDAAPAGPRLRPRTGALESGVGVTNPGGVVDLITNLDSGHNDPAEVDACARAFSADRAGGYGYLAWRFAAAYRRIYPQLPARTPHHDLAVIVYVVAAEKQLVDQLTSAHGAFLQQPALAQRALDSEFSELLDADDFGSAAADELRRVRAREQFLRHALVFTIANPACGQRLWDVLDRIRPPAVDRLIETNPQLKSAIERLNELITAAETLLTADTAALDQFLSQSLTELVDVQAGRYDFLTQFEGIESSTAATSRRKINGLAFALLPSGEKLRAYLDGIRSSGRYRGYAIDEDRLKVLEALESHFGTDRCQWHEGTESSGGVNNQYMVLTAKSDNGSGEHAVAIS